MNLTGRTRYRTGRTFWGKEIVVLQVEYTYEAPIVSYSPNPRYKTKHTWRDATLVDLTMLKDRDLSE